MPALLNLLPLPDLAALLLFFLAWVGYAQWARWRSRTRLSILATTNQLAAALDAAGHLPRQPHRRFGRHAEPVGQPLSSSRRPAS
jgi:hypothetical protein